MADPSDYAFAINGRAYKLNAQEKALAGTTVKIYKFNTGRPTADPDPALDFNGTYGKEYYVVGIRPSTALAEREVRPYKSSLKSRLSNPNTLEEALETDSKTLRVVHSPSNAGRCYSVGRRTPGGIFLPGFPLKEDKVFFFSQFREDLSTSKEARKKLWREVRKKEVERLKKERGEAVAADEAEEIEAELEEDEDEEDKEEQEEEENGDEIEVIREVGEHRVEEDAEMAKKQLADEAQKQLVEEDKQMPKRDMQLTEETKKQGDKHLLEANTQMAESRKRKTISEAHQNPIPDQVHESSLEKEEDTESNNKRRKIHKKAASSDHVKPKSQIPLGYSSTLAQEIMPEMKKEESDDERKPKAPSGSLSIVLGQQQTQEVVPATAQGDEPVVKAEPTPMINATILRLPDYITNAENATDQNWSKLMEELKTSFPALFRGMEPLSKRDAKLMIRALQRNNFHLHLRQVQIFLGIFQDKMKMYRLLLDDKDQELDDFMLRDMCDQVMHVVKKVAE